MGNTDRSPLTGNTVMGAPEMRHTPSSESKIKKFSLKALAIALSAISVCAALILISVLGGKHTPVEAADVCIGTQAGCMASVTGGAGRYFVGTEDIVTTEPPETPDGDVITDAPDMSPDDQGETPSTSDRFTVTFEFYGKDSISCSMTSPSTVGDIADKLGITFDESEVSSVALDQVVSGNIVITTDSVTYSTMSVKTEIPYETKYVDTDELYKGNSRTVQYGINGESITEYEIKYVNGIEVSRTVVKTYVSREVQHQIIEKGTKVYTPPVYNTGGSGITSVVGGKDGGTFVGGDGKTYTYSYYIDVKATIYYAGGYCATGAPADETVIAVDPKVIPLGTKVYITGDYADIGVRSAEDVGGGIKGNIIDICLDRNNPLAYNFGFRPMRVYILA